MIFFMKELGFREKLMFCSEGFRWWVTGYRFEVRVFVGRVVFFV